MLLCVKSDAQSMVVLGGLVERHSSLLLDVALRRIKLEDESEKLEVTYYCLGSGRSLGVSSVVVLDPLEQVLFGCQADATVEMSDLNAHSNIYSAKTVFTVRKVRSLIGEIIPDELLITEGEIISSSKPYIAVGDAEVCEAADRTRFQVPRGERDGEVKWLSMDGIILYMCVRDRLLGNGWMEDLEIDMMQKIIVWTYKHLREPLSTLLHDRYRAIHPNMFQIIHIGGNHWIIVSTVGVADASFLRVYDSINYGDSNLLASRLRHMYGSSVKYTIREVNTQIGLNSCGDYCCAIAIELARGLDPALAFFAYQRMRSHLIYCLESKYAYPFPKEDR